MPAATPDALCPFTEGSAKVTWAPAQASCSAIHDPSAPPPATTTRALDRPDMRRKPLRLEPQVKGGMTNFDHAGGKARSILAA